MSKKNEVHSEKQVNSQTAEQVNRLEVQMKKVEEMLSQSHLRDIAYHFSNRREVIKVNLLAGLARGIGLTVGTALFLAFLFYLLSNIVTLPYVGEHIAELLDVIEQYRQF